MDDESLNTVASHCPVCGQEYRPGFTHCADDGTELVPGPAPAPDDESNDDRPGSERTDLADLSSDLGPPVELGTFPVLDAVLLAGHLRSVGIPAVSEADTDDSPYRLAGMGGLTRVFVRPEDLERARAAADAIPDQPAEDDGEFDDGDGDPDLGDGDTVGEPGDRASADAGDEA